MATTMRFLCAQRHLLSRRLNCGMTPFFITVVLITSTSIGYKKWSANKESVRHGAVLIAGAADQLYSSRSRASSTIDNSQLIEKPFPGFEHFRQYTKNRLGLAPLEGVAALKQENAGRVLNDVTAYHYPLNVDPCRTSRGGDSVSIFFAVISAIGNDGKRQRIRQTWAKLARETNSLHFAGFAFFVGRHRHDNSAVQRMIEDEAAVHKDIVQIDMVDSYRDLTVKAVGVINWLNSYCRSAKFTVKSDDDVFVNVRYLVQVVKKVSSSMPAVYGGLSPWGTLDAKKLMRNPGHKNHVSYEEWPWSTIPRYLSGNCILISGAAILPLLAAAQVTPYFWLEDTYLTGLCARQAGVQLHTSDSFFDLSSVWNFPLDPCYAHETVSWVAGDMNVSQFAVDNFYRNITLCYLNKTSTNGNGSTFEPVLADPTTFLPIEFEILN